MCGSRATMTSDELQLISSYLVLVAPHNVLCLVRHLVLALSAAPTILGDTFPTRPQQQPRASIPSERAKRNTPRAIRDSNHGHHRGL